MIISSGHRKKGFFANGGSVLHESDMNSWKNEPLMTDPMGICFELGKDVKEVDDGFFDLFPTLSEIVINDPECVVYLSESSAEHLRKNGVTIRGGFDTSAEKLAREYGLRFLHIDTLIGREGNYFELGVNTVELRFYDDGSAYINQDCSCQGISAGNTGGGEARFSLPKDFYLTMSAKDIAEKCWGCCYDSIIRKGILAGLIKKAKLKKGFLICCSKRSE